MLLQDRLPTSLVTRQMVHEETNLSLRENTIGANLIYLCPEHHKEIDDEPEIYTVEWLRQLKKDHEAAVERAIAHSYSAGRSERLPCRSPKWRFENPSVGEHRRLVPVGTTGRAALDARKFYRRVVPPTMAL